MNTRRFQLEKSFGFALVLAGLGACGDGSTLHADAATAPDTIIPDAADTAGPDQADTSEPDVADTFVPPPPVGRVVINEVECNADPVEWVELKNVGDAAIDLTGMRIADKQDEPGVRVPAVVLAPGAYTIVRGELGISCERDVTFLLGRGQVLDIAPVRVGDPELATWGRFPDGVGSFVEVAPTPQKANRPIEDDRASLFAGEGTMPIIDFFVDGPTEEKLINQHREWASVIFTWTDDRGTSAPQMVDIRIKGAITDRPWTARPSLKLHFARHEAPGPRSFRGVKKLALHAMVYDPSTIREWLAYEVMRQTGVPGPRVGWAVVRVNGQAKGLYGVIESYDEIFLRDWYADTVALYEADGDLTPGLPGIFLDEGDSMEPLARLVDRIDAVFTNNSAPTFALPEIDWLQLARMFGAEDVLQHSDGMKSGCHNYYLHVGTDNRWSFMAWSVDLTLLPGYGGPGPIGSCSRMSQLCDKDERCTTWFRRARDLAAQAILRTDLRTPALARAARNQAYVDLTKEPFSGNDFFPEVSNDLVKNATQAIDILEARARLIRCATATEQGQPDPGDPSCGGFVGGSGPGPK